jgi:hypothetical protein
VQLVGFAEALSSRRILPSWGMADVAKIQERLHTEEQRGCRSSGGSV